ncbi:hypothetical protein [Flavobacterium sp.]|uniref:hypothetical protein n=1 Tax=Flavobacterium sp. TaxID=239 RepID=UPI0031D11154
MEHEKDFETFKKEVIWFLKPNSNIKFIKQDFRISKEFSSTFPKLSLLIEKARVSNIKIDNQDYILFAWNDLEDNICGWLNKIENEENKTLQLIHEHQLLLKNIGGIQESFNCPENSFCNNQNFMFINSECFNGIGEYEDYYISACEEESFERIDSSDFLSFAYEANGALTMYNPHNKEIFLFSHDHSFDNVNFIKNQPEYTFHSFKNVTTYVDYVEELANQWIEHIK